MSIIISNPGSLANEFESNQSPKWFLSVNII